MGEIAGQEPNASVEVQDGITSLRVHEPFFPAAATSDVRSSGQEPPSEEQEEEIDWDSIPQRSPEGLRVGGDEERRTVTCPTCGGKGSYEIDIFVRKVGQTLPVAEKTQQACAACNATGRVEEV